MFGWFPFATFRFFRACGGFPGLPPRFFVSVRLGFPGGPFILLLEFLLTPSHRTVSPISRSFSASLPLEMCPTCGVVALSN